MRQYVKIKSRIKMIALHGHGKGIPYAVGLETVVTCLARQNHLKWIRAKVDTLLADVMAKTGYNDEDAKREIVDHADFLLSDWEIQCEKELEELKREEMVKWQS